MSTNEPFQVESAHIHSVINECNWFQCLTAHGTKFSIRDGVLSHSIESAISGEQIWIFRPQQSDPLAFIVSNDLDVRFSIYPSLYKATCIPVFLKESGTYTSLLLVEERNYLAAVEIGDGVAFGNVEANRRQARAWELFELSHFDTTNISQGILDLGLGIVDLLKLRSDPSRLAAALVDRSRWRAFEGIMHLLPLDHKIYLAKLIIDYPIRLSEMVDQYASDPWASVAAPALSKFIRNDSQSLISRVSAIGPEYDWLGDRYLPEERRGIRPNSAAEILVRNRREDIAPSRRACVVATARNEGIYFLEWIAYHRSIGFEDFFIYTNDNDDQSEELLNVLARLGIINVIYSSLGGTGNSQAKAYGHAFGFNEQTLSYSWTMVCDLDEFLVLDPSYFANVHDFLSWHETNEVDCISLSWNLVDAAGQTRWIDRPSFDRFTSAPFWFDRKIKSIFKTRRVAQSYAHFPCEFDTRRLVFRNSIGDIRRTHEAERKHGIYGRHLDDDPEFRFGSFSHYYWKSAEEFLWKHSRNKGDHILMQARSLGHISHKNLELYLKHFGSPPAPR